MRAPSSFYSSAASPSCASASSTSSAESASIGCTGRNSWTLNAREAAARLRRARRAPPRQVAGHHRGAPHARAPAAPRRARRRRSARLRARPVAARRRGGGTRNSVRQRWRARTNRAAARSFQSSNPPPAARAMRSKTASTSRSSMVGDSAGSTTRALATSRQPRPMRLCGSVRRETRRRWKFRRGRVVRADRRGGRSCRVGR